MTSGQGTAVPLSPQWGTVADGYSMGTQHRHPDGADGAKLERASDYRLLALAEPGGDPAALGTQVGRDSHGATRRTEDQGQRAAGNGTGQHTLLAHFMPEEDNDLSALC